MSKISATPQAQRHGTALRESTAVKTILIGIALAFLALFLFLPLVIVFMEALRRGFVT